MKFILQRELLLKPLQQVVSILSGRPTLPVLSNILLQVKKGYLLITSTDLELEIVARIMLDLAHDLGAATVPARKFYNICRSLPESSEMTVTLESSKIKIRSGGSRFSLSTLLASDFPNLDDWQVKIEFDLSQSFLKKLIKSTQFAMAYQDVRYYLNGMLFETKGVYLYTVATDGHRLAVCSMSLDKALPSYSVIVPRKGVIELVHMLDDSKEQVKFQIGSNNICASIGDYVLTSKLIDGCFPDYRRVLPKNISKILEVNCDLLKQAFARAAILSNEKLRGVRLHLKNNQLKITTNNHEHEEAEETLNVTYYGSEIEIGINVNYMLDVLNALKCKDVRLLLTNETSSIQVEDCTSQAATYIIMPMRI